MRIQKKIYWTQKTTKMIREKEKRKQYKNQQGNKQQNYRNL